MFNIFEIAILLMCICVCVCMCVYMCVYCGFSNGYGKDFHPFHPFCISWGTSGISRLIKVYMLNTVSISRELLIYIIVYHSDWKQSRVLVIPILIRKLQRKSSITSGAKLFEGRTVFSSWNLNVYEWGELLA